MVTYGRNGEELVRKGYKTINGKTEEYIMPKPIRGIERYPDDDKIVDPNDKQWERYFKTIDKVGINFNVPEIYLIEDPINTKTADIIGKAKERMKEIDEKEMQSEKEDASKDTSKAER